jgi:acetylornithine deacetylase
MPALADTDLLARLVSYNSVSSSSNVPIADFAAEYLREHASDSVRIEHFDATGPDEAEKKVNLLATCGPESGTDADRRGLVLCGHLDVVPANEPDWRSDPFTLTERDGTLIGRGAADMKGFDALAINLLIETSRRAGDMTRPLVLLLTCDEEVGSVGASRFVERHRDRALALPRNCIIGEPTSLRAVRMHKGHLAMRITLRGVAAHSGSPHLGRNAIEPAGRVILAMTELRERFEQMTLETSRYFGAVPFPVLNVATIHGGDAINVVPESCAIELGIRLMPGQDRDEVLSTVQAAAREAAGQTPIDIERLRENPPLLTDEDAPLHRAICTMIGQRESLGVSYASDGGWLSTADLDCVLFGPGTIEVAHKPNESIALAELVRARDLLSRLIEQMCF